MKKKKKARQRPSNDRLRETNKAATADISGRQLADIHVRANAVIYAQKSR